METKIQHYVKDQSFNPEFFVLCFRVRDDLLTQIELIILFNPKQRATKMFKLCH